MYFSQSAFIWSFHAQPSGHTSLNHIGAQAKTVLPENEIACLRSQPATHPIILQPGIKASDESAVVIKSPQATDVVVIHIGWPYKHSAWWKQCCHNAHVSAHINMLSMEELPPLHNTNDILCTYEYCVVILHIL